MVHVIHIRTQAKQIADSQGELNAERNRLEADRARLQADRARHDAERARLTEWEVGAVGNKNSLL